MSTPDGPAPNSGSADDWAMVITRSLNDQRARAQAFLKRQRERRVQPQAPASAGSDISASQGPRGDGLTDADLATMAGRLLGEVEKLRVELSHARQRTRADGDDSHPPAPDGEADAHVQALQAQLDDLRAERQQLSDRLVESEQVDDEPSTNESTDQPYEDLRRRFELAVEDVRELKAHNAELEEKLRQGGHVEPVAASDGASDGALDWEAQKQQLLAQLEDFDEDNEDEAGDKLTVDGAIRITDQVVAEKDREIAELKVQLEDAPAERQYQAATAERIDNDETVQNERARLLALQEDWKEKLRRAEVEISVEKAKLARERTQVEEQIHAYEARLAEQESGNAASGDSGKPKKSGSRRWLSRLGLTDDD